MDDYLAEYLEGIDACVFSGCNFDEPENRVILRDYMARWEREMVRTEAAEAEEVIEITEDTKVTEIK